MSVLGLVIGLIFIGGFVVATILLMARERRAQRRREAQEAERARQRQADEAEAAARLKAARTSNADGRWEWSADRNTRRVTTENARDAKRRMRNVERDVHGKALMVELEQRSREQAERTRKRREEEAEEDRRRRMRDDVPVVASNSPSYSPHVEADSRSGSFGGGSYKTGGGFGGDSYSSSSSDSGSSSGGGDGGGGGGGGGD